jgi:hypothetical protein
MMAKLMGGMVSVRAVAGTEAAFTDTFGANSLSLNKPVPLSKFNHDGSAPTNLAVVNGTETLVPDTDYRIIQYAGAYFLLLISDSTFDDSLATAVTYTVTPAASWIMGRGSQGLSQPLSMKLTNKRQAEDGRTISRVWELPYGFCTSDDVITLKSGNEADNVAEVPLTFEFAPHPDLITDSDLEKESLIRETEEV